MKRVISGFLCAIMILSVCLVPAHATVQSNKYISQYGSQIVARGNGVVHVDFHTVGTGVLDVVGAEYIRIYENGYLVKTFSYINPLYSSSMVGTNTWFFFGGVDYQGTAGKTYYAQIVHYGEKSGGSGVEGTQTASVIAT